jgi:uncharacterized protein (DUF924 family)
LPEKTSFQPVLDFWFDDRARALWFKQDPSFDAEIRGRFEALADEAAAGRLQDWIAAPDSCLALVIAQDQFPRNMYRGNPRAFATDPEARRAADAAIARGHDRAIPLDRRMFFYLPFEHSEAAADQRRSVALFRRWMEAHEGPARLKAEEQFVYVLRHEEIVLRFGRFPHRNPVLGRSSTPEEEAFLAEPRSSF